ncbi:MAG: RNA-binding protein [Leptospiraceae bacterium]|nr:RNA-binding protein [Leptospiraceae bacterium]
MNIYVGNLAHAVSEQELGEAFGKFGEVVSIKIITDKFTGLRRGFAFVEMANKEDGEKSIEALNGKALKNRELIVNEAKPREDRKPFQKRSGGKFNR